tara:strand:+ start:522 stop:845 length:324 start_codon:yes stop_codon:yes gene_type:complete
MELKTTQTDLSAKKGMSLKSWIITILSGVYIVSPIDFIPDTIPVIGWMDDILVAITGISTVLDSQLSQANRTLSNLLKAVKYISFSLWAILGMLVLIFGTLIYQIFN